MPDLRSELEQRFGWAADPPPAPVPVPYRTNRERRFQRTMERRRMLAEAQNHRCAYCAVRLSDEPNTDAFATIDEVRPKSAGGPAAWFNQVMACWLCNNGKSARSAEVYFLLVQRWGRVEAYLTSVKPRRRTYVRNLIREGRLL